MGSRSLIITKYHMSSYVGVLAKHRNNEKMPVSIRSLGGSSDDHFPMV